MQSFTPAKMPLVKVARWLLTTCACFFLLIANATIRRVDAGISNPGNGSSWANAYRNLQAAINASVSGDDIWIKAGNYTPTGLPNEESFTMKNGVKIYGGFNGTETALGQQNWIVNRVYLKQINNNYPIILNNNINSTALLDGVNIADANLTNPTFIYSAGMHNTGRSFPTINNVAFTNNSTGLGVGGALYIEGGNIAITNVSFTNNRALRGGAAYFKNCTPVLTNVVFTANY